MCFAKEMSKTAIPSFPFSVSAARAGTVPEIRSKGLLLSMCLSGYAPAPIELVEALP